MEEDNAMSSRKTSAKAHKSSSKMEVASVEEADISDVKSKSKPDYNLRKKTIINRIKTEKKKSLPKQPKPKTSPAPLSKYRRRAANSRERGRMEDINDAFDVLKGVLPDIENTSGNKVTKITTLRLAMNYISALRGILVQEEGYSGSSSEACSSSDLNSDGDSMGTPSLSSGEEPCLSPEYSETDFLPMDFLENVNIDFETDPEKILLEGS